MEEHVKAPSKRVAQHRLAREVLAIVHGLKIAKEAEEEHRALFTRRSSISGLNTAEQGNKPLDRYQIYDTTTPTSNADKVPFHNVVLPRCLVYNQPISKVMYHAGMVASRSEGHRMVVNKGVYIGSRPDATGRMDDQLKFSPACNWDGQETEKCILGGDSLIIRMGKWKVKVIKIISDAEFEAGGFSAPGWTEEKTEDPGREREKDEARG